MREKVLVNANSKWGKWKLTSFAGRRALLFPTAHAAERGVGLELESRPRSYYHLLARGWLVVGGSTVRGSPVGGSARVVVGWLRRGGRFFEVCAACRRKFLIVDEWLLLLLLLLLLLPLPVVPASWSLCSRLPKDVVATENVAAGRAVGRGIHRWRADCEVK